MTAFRWQPYAGPHGKSWMLAPATVTPAGYVVLCAIARVWPTPDKRGYCASISYAGQVSFARTAYTSAPRAKAYVARQLAQMPNPPSIVGGRAA